MTAQLSLTHSPVMPHTADVTAPPAPRWPRLTFLVELARACAILAVLAACTLLNRRSHAP